jgi:uncharacterized protein HemY
LLIVGLVSLIVAVISGRIIADAEASYAAINATAQNYELNWIMFSIVIFVALFLVIVGALRAITWLSEAVGS